MIDTVVLRFHGILDLKNDVLSEIQKQAREEDQKKLSPELRHEVDLSAVPAHHDLYKAMVKFKGKNFTIQNMVKQNVVSDEEINESEFLNRENSKQQTQYHQIRNKIRIRDEKGVKEFNMRINGKYRVPSSESDVTFSINESASFIDIQFSIPKYLHGHSLAEFIPQGGSSLASNDHFNFTFEWQKKHLYKRLKKVIDQFCTDLFSFFELELSHDWNYLELRRIDICYNQRFESKAEAFEYLKAQSKINYKRKREKSSSAKDYDTSIAYKKSNSSYVKIYHKGSEYSATNGDRKKHLKVNQDFINDNWLNFSDSIREGYRLYKKELDFYYKNVGLGLKTSFPKDKSERIKRFIKKFNPMLPYDIPFLKREMDKVLRYEISYSTKALSLLYKTKAFRVDCKYHKRAKKRYHAVVNNFNRKLDLQEKVKHEDLKHHKMFNAFQNRSIRLMLSPDPVFLNRMRKGKHDYNEETGVYNITTWNYPYTLLKSSDVGVFSSDFLGVLIDEFLDFFQHYQIKQIDNFADFKDKVLAYNRGVDKRIKTYNEFNAFKTLDELGNPKRDYKGKPLKPHQLLTQAEKRKLKLKKVNVNQFLMIYDSIRAKIDSDGQETGSRSLDQLREDLQIPKSTFNRWKQDLKLFDIVTSSLDVKKEIKCSNDFKEYYWLTQGYDYQNSLYTSLSKYRLS